MLVIILGIVLVGVIAAGPIMSNVETPKYSVTQTVGDIEIRQYQPMVIAEVTMSGEREEAIGGGFRLLADYIFGNNLVDQNIAMTAPVQQQKSTKIAMTAPVQQQSSGNQWQVSFVMPSEYTLEKLPKPVNDRVVLKAIPAKTFVAIRFSGNNSDENVEKHQKQLMDYIQTHQLSTVGAPKYAFYNPPWTLPPMRRNEVMIELKP